MDDGTSGTHASSSQSFYCYKFVAGEKRKWLNFVGVSP